MEASVGEEPMSDEEPEMNGDLPLPPPPPGLKLPTPPPPPAMDTDISELPPPPPPQGINLEESPSSSFNDTDDDSKDFNSMWEKKKQSDPTFSDDNRDRMYGHIDRITTGEVGTLLDRFSDRFGSELDREIIVLRKKQQQAIRDIKPTVELISPPTVEFEDEAPEDDDADTSSDSSDQFVEFFDVVNTLLGNMPDEFVNAFIASEDFQLFQSVGESPSATSDEDRTTFFTMINRVLGDLPDDKINEFVESPGFAIFQAMGEIYGA